ncbi:hypothetical protein DPMN_043724 [Dreissena polymorpha]|uniref:Uncharacterized protein n=1 Tax=Dreissena polymorpha TaxID=45954 RepID=A0A9D4D1Z9_DREPO|nr:hypothetical protein DPMN_043724 [Dreissena polymorpha]
MAEQIQNCALIATKKSGLETTSGPMETRDYELNSEKAMKKKLCDHKGPRECQGDWWWAENRI